MVSSLILAGRGAGMLCAGIVTKWATILGIAHSLSVCVRQAIEDIA